MIALIHNVSLTMFIALFCFASSHAQVVNDYTPRKTYDKNSKALINSILQQLPEELDRIKSRKRGEITQFYIERTAYLTEKVEEGVFIDDDTLQTLVQSVLRRITSNNHVKHPPKRILILKNPDVNAFCHLDGSFIVNVGLLGRIRNESGLAFAIAHEMAHFELDHIRKRITQYVENSESRAIKRSMSTLENDKVTIQEIDSVRKFIYTFGRYSRAREKEADSLGFVLFKNAGYNQDQAATLLALLDSGTYLKHRIADGLFSSLNFSKFPFKSFWLTQRPRVFSKKHSNTYIFSNDSIDSHPDALMRRSILHERVTNHDRPLNIQQTAFVNKAITIAEFESIESAYHNRLYDRCLFLALQQFNLYPKNKYLVTTIAKVFIDLLEAHEKGIFNFVVPAYTGNYSEEMRQVNNFVHNISVEELGEVAFNFLNNQTNFDPNKSDHYYLLWKICDLTRRMQVKEKVKERYRAKFDSKDAKYNLIR
ncbi:M48 family metallopeptidase [Pseudochryseolinea flava]|uniref:Peptidase M48 domain-containing protein n=1 Tax=Pseudochryseolinea flava TaxID=2059302 RepID=A0A364Y2I4_9BACT|nr:M48 family metallopeptidase [Pseudochryseolinea flava]RAW00317.1 hypothetical protein DQQ10_14785 [Pseudochryseolinea flava]